MKNKVIICFPTNGGVRQFTDELYDKLKNDYTYDILGGKKTNRFKILKYLLYKEIIFSSNNILVYLILPLITRKITLILHDHKIRKGASFKEKLILNLFHIFRFRFNKVIIHSKIDDDAIKLLKYKNVHYSYMPPHGMPKSPNYTINDYIPYTTPIKILCFGRIEKYKNFEYIANVISSNSNYTLTIAGSGEISEQLKHLIKKNHNITLLNKYILDHELTQLMNTHHYLALPYSDLTQTGLIELSGFFGKPIILSNIPAFMEYKNYSFCHYISLDNIELAKKELDVLKDINETDYISLCNSSKNSFNSKISSWATYIEALKY
ncbi:glycosyltransferase [Providencia rettgeri]|uniref:glycosyltransferase n=1 Tax=Providencia rettgeri TaxID=587 RepID=UPI001BA7F2D6|nr:glycosyltransferase [Providencia rettgeri]MBS0916725.1 glycosyltransferase [Providencia rettgeri]